MSRYFVPVWTITIITLLVLQVKATDTGQCWRCSDIKGYSQCLLFVSVEGPCNWQQNQCLPNPQKCSMMSQIDCQRTQGCILSGELCIAYDITKACPFYFVRDLCLNAAQKCLWYKTPQTGYSQGGIQTTQQCKPWTATVSDCYSLDQESCMEVSNCYLDKNLFCQVYLHQSCSMYTDYNACVKPYQGYKSCTWQYNQCTQSGVSGDVVVSQQALQQIQTNPESCAYIAIPTQCMAASTSGCVWDMQQSQCYSSAPNQACYKYLDSTTCSRSHSNCIWILGNSYYNPGKCMNQSCSSMSFYTCQPYQIQTNQGMGMQACYWGLNQQCQAGNAINLLEQQCSSTRSGTYYTWNGLQCLSCTGRNPYQRTNTMFKSQLHFIMTVIILWINFC